MNKLCVFGGSFDPPHVGHEMIINELIKLDFDIILIMPTKDVEYKTLTSDVYHRSNMVNILVDKYDGKIKFSDLELIRIGVTKTCDTIKELKVIYPDYKIHFAMGSDSLNTLPYWDEFDYLKDNVVFVVADRGGVNFVDGVECIFINNDVNLVSSTYIRNNLDSSFLDKNVYNYIIENNLYE